MDRGARSAVATFFADAELAAGARLDVGEAAAHHARVRRLDAGDAIRLTNGRGALASARIDRLSKSTLTVAVAEISRVPKPPLLRLFLPVADRDRMLWLAEKCAELAVSVWQPVMFRRSASVSPRGEGEAFTAKVRARMISALEQSGGAWLPEVMPVLSLEDALVRHDDDGDHRFLLDRAGAPLAKSTVGDSSSLMVGPEGGIELEEHTLIVGRHGWRPVSLGDTTLRFETAGVVGVGLLRALMHSL